MILSVLKFVVKVVVAIVTLVVELAKCLYRIAFDAGVQAKQATPGVIDALVAEAREVAAKSPTIMAQVNADLRKTLKVKTPVKVSSN